MTPQEQAAFRAAVKANPACAAAYAARDCHAIAAIMSVGRTTPNDREIGNGTIIEVLGIEAANSFLDAINQTAAFRYVKPLIAEGRFRIGSPLAQATVQSFVGSLLTQAQADALCALGKSPATYFFIDVADALFNADGSER
jgi:hypothetical protein